MCGRYFIDDETSKEIKKILQQIDKKSASSEFGCRDIRPSDRAPVLTARKGAVDAEMIEWGFPGFQKKGLIINARSETVLEKPMFRDSVLNRRCILPASGYYAVSYTHLDVYKRQSVPTGRSAGMPGRGCKRCG